MKKFKFVAMASLLGLVIASTAIAADFVKPGDDTSNVNLSAEQTYRNLYTAGDNVVINSNVSEDLVAAGGMIRLSGDVEDDVILAGGTLDLSGSIGGNARLAGGNVTISGSIDQDLLVVGGNVYVDQESVIAGDFIVGAGNVDLQARVAGKANINGSTITINNVIEGDVTIRAEQRLTFGPNSIVNGTITYYGNNDAVISEGAQVSEFSRQPLPKSSFNERLFATGLIGAGLIITLIAWLLASLLLLYLVREPLEKTTDLMRNEPWAGLGIGLLALILGPVVIIALLLTIFGYYIALLAAMVYVLALALSCLVGAIFLGRVLYRFINPNLVGIDWQVVLLGVVAIKILELIPFVGWLAIFIISLMAFGTILRLTWGNLRQSRATAPPDQPTI